MGRRVKRRQQRKTQEPRWLLLSPPPLMPSLPLKYTYKLFCPFHPYSRLSFPLTWLPSILNFLHIRLITVGDCTVTCAMTQCSNTRLCKPCNAQGGERGLHSSVPSTCSTLAGVKYGSSDAPSVAMVNPYPRLTVHSAGRCKSAWCLRCESCESTQPSGEPKVYVGIKTHHDIQKILKTPPKKLLEIIDKYSKVAGYKINTQKSVVSIH